MDFNSIRFASSTLFPVFFRFFIFPHPLVLSLCFFRHLPSLFFFPFPSFFVFFFVFFLLPSFHFPFPGCLSTSISPAAVPLPGSPSGSASSWHRGRASLARCPWQCPRFRPRHSQAARALGVLCMPAVLPGCNIPVGMRGSRRKQLPAAAGSLEKRGGGELGGGEQVEAASGLAL